MLKHIFQTLLVTCVVTGTLLAATDPFVGTWKLNQMKSKIIGEQGTIRSLGGNKYTFTFGNITDTVVANGTYQAVHFGQTESLKSEGPNTWERVLKKDGCVILTETWTIAPDGKTMNIQGIVHRPDGSTSSEHVVLKRVAGAKGLAGRWQSTQLKIGSPTVLEIKPYDGNGLSLITPSEHETQNMKLDGKDYPDEGPNVPAGTASSGHRVNKNTLEITDKIKGKVMDTVQFKVSPALKTMTLTVHEKGQPTPLTLVYDRQ